MSNTRTTITRRRRRYDSYTVKWDVRNGYLAWNHSGKKIPNGHYIYAINEEANILAMTLQTNTVEHDFFFGQASILAAGCIDIQQGVITCVNNSGGNFRPTPESTVAAIRFLVTTLFQYQFDIQLYRHTD